MSHDPPPDLFAASGVERVPASSSGLLDLPEYRQRLAGLAAHGLYLGTASWRYPGWRGSIYDEQRYLRRGKFSNPLFDEECLREYAETFHSVCVDSAYYRIPTESQIGVMAAQVPDGFQFAYKVSDEFTVKRFPNLPRHGQRRGMENVNFLNAEMFTRLFLGACAPHQAKVGPLIFEFSTFSKKEFEHGRDFVEQLDRFLGQLPSGWRYAVEIRNKTWLQPEYFAALRRHNVAHVFNNWARMPSVGEQLQIPGASDTADFAVARFLTKPGLSYENSVDIFEPYDSLKEPNPEARAAAAEFLERCFVLTKKGYIYINNRMEGFAPATLQAITDELDQRGLKYKLIK